MDRHPGEADTLPATPLDGALVPLAAGTEVGRYVIRDYLGAGGMGTVYRAFDPQLSRHIAIKLLALGKDSEADAKRARVMREAHALARISHPNVIAVYDVGVVERTVFIAMELIDGVTLRQWLHADPPRPRAEVLTALIAAGRGLAAAHRAGLVHRDFKPENVMVARDGRVRVLDFGLARVSTFEEPEGRAVTLPPQGFPSGSAGETIAGTVMGTPRYMAPEQRRGEPADERSDQWAFCVVLYEALCGGQHPYADDGPPRAPDAKVQAPPSGTRLPGWLRAVIDRGLAIDRAQRFPTITALLHELDRDRDALRSKLAIGGAFVALAGAATWALLRNPGAARAPEGERCRGAERALAGVWDGDARAALRAKFAATGRGHAAATADRVVDRLDGWTTGWVAARTAACEATARGEQSPQLLDQRMACFDRRLAEASALTALYTADGVDAAMVDGALDGVARLTALDGCDRADALAAGWNPDPAARARAAEAARMLDAAEAPWRIGRFDEAQRLADAATPTVEALGDPGLRARLLMLRVELAWERDDFTTAAELTRQVARAAGDAHDDILGARAWIKLVSIQADQHLNAEASATVAVAEAALARAGDPPKEHVQLLLNRADVPEREGRLPEALALVQEAVSLAGDKVGRDERITLAALARQATLQVQLGELPSARGTLEAVLAAEEAQFGPDHPRVGTRLDQLGAVMTEMGEPAAALPLHERALAILVATYGETSAIASALNNHGQALRALGRRDDALVLYRRSLAVREQAFGLDDPRVAKSLNYIGGTLSELGRQDEAAEAFRRALAIREAKNGPDHPETGLLVHNLGLTFRERGLNAEARPLLERALGIFERSLGPDHPNVAMAKVSLGEIELDEGAFVKALTWCKGALAIDTAALGDDHPLLAGDLVCIGRARLGMGRAELAVKDLERALALEADGSAPPSALAETRFALAQALWDAGGDRARARTLATEAKQGASAKRAKQIDAWLGAHR